MIERNIIVSLVLVFACHSSALAQVPVETPAGLRSELSIDEQLLFDVYELNAPAFRSYMRAVNATYYSLLVGGALYSWIDWKQESNGICCTVWNGTTESVATALFSVIGLKLLFARPRPYAVLPEITSRAGKHEGAPQRYAFPSGHSATAFALAVSWSLRNPDWYVVAPSLLWASSVGVSRIWLGVHYPSDVLVGALLGSGIALGIHHFDRHSRNVLLGTLLGSGIALGIHHFDDRLSKHFSLLLPKSLRAARIQLIPPPSPGVRIGF